MNFGNLNYKMTEPCTNDVLDHKDDAGLSGHCIGGIYTVYPITSIIPIDFYGIFQVSKNIFKCSVSQWRLSPSFGIEIPRDSLFFSD